MSKSTGNDADYVPSRRSALVAEGGLPASSTHASPSRSSEPISASPAPADEPIATHALDTTPENQAATYRHFDRQHIANRVIPRDPTRSTPLPRSGKSLDGLRYTYQGTERTLDRYVTDTRIAGLLVLEDNAIVHEHYAMGNTETSRWTSASIAKSFTGTLIGAALADGAIASLDDPIPRYVPELGDSAYKDNTIRQLLEMSSGVEWTEAGATDPYGDNDIARMFQAVYGYQPGAVMELMRTRPRAAAPGSVFNYSTGESYVLSAVVANATGKTASDYLSEKIWRPAGMEADAYWILDAPGGREMGGSCIQATLRDFGRFGQFIMNASEGVLPTGWRDEAGKPESATTDYGRLYPEDPDNPYGYGYHWWAIRSGTAGACGPVPTFMAAGHAGQKLYINPAERVVVVQWAAWRDEDSSENGYEFLAVLDAVVNALR
ncbi:serine hydrolase [Nocardia sp. NPDC050710]|uniref:serine hydrolase domain-containing protein n=1 Tax=Nocardia sp. NPDC050710 TaxID=3157220 RepID=UPI0033E61970